MPRPSLVSGTIAETSGADQFKPHSLIVCRCRRSLRRRRMRLQARNPPLTPTQGDAYIAPIEKFSEQPPGARLIFRADQRRSITRDAEFRMLKRWHPRPAPRGRRHGGCRPATAPVPVTSLRRASEHTGRAVSGPTCSLPGHRGRWSSEPVLIRSSCSSRPGSVPDRCRPYRATSTDDAARNVVPASIAQFLKQPAR